MITNPLLEFLGNRWSEIGFLLSSIGTAFMWFKNSDKRKQEIELTDNEILSGDIKNLSEFIGLYKDTIEDLRNEFNELKKEYKARGVAYDELELKFNIVSQTLEEYDRKIKSLSAENVGLIKKVKACSICPMESVGN